MSLLLAGIGIGIGIGVGVGVAQGAGKSYKWGDSISAPLEYPVEIYEGALTSVDHTYPFSPIWGLIGVD